MPYALLAFAAVVLQQIFYIRTPFTGAEISNRQSFDAVVTLGIVGFWLLCGLAWLRARRAGGGAGSSA